MTTKNPNWAMSEDAATIDGEHRVQVVLLEALQSAVEAGRGADEVAEILQRFHEYTRLHFLSEELLMRLHAYPQQAGHEQEHQRMLEDCDAVQRALREDRTEEALRTVRGFRSRLMAHIGSHDGEFTRFIAAGDS